MKLWVDDIRPAPEGWTHAYTAPGARAYLSTGRVEEISLDHDLGQDETGYDILNWIERCVYDGSWYGPLPVFHLHTANPVGRMRMERAITHIIEAYAAKIAKNT